MALDEHEPTHPDPPRRPAPGWGAGALVAAGLLFLALGLVLGAAYLVGGVRSSLLPTGWILPLILVATGALMTARRRFDIVTTLWAGLFLVVLLLDTSVFMRALDQGLEDPAAFDATVIVVMLGLVPLVLRPAFRS